MAVSHAAVQAAREATTTVPIVMFAVADPVALGWVASLARPGGNLTGVVIEPDTLLVDKRLHLLKELVPRASRLGLLTTGEPQVQEQVRAAQRATAGMGLTVVLAEARDRDYARAFQRLTAERAHALFVPASALLNRDRKRIIELCARHRLPAMYQWRESVEEGGLIACGSSITELARRTAAYVDRILRGASPAELPVEQPTTYELALNQATARALGLAIPPSLLIQADHVVGR